MSNKIHKKIHKKFHKKLSNKNLKKKVMSSINKKIDIDELETSFYTSETKTETETDSNNKSHFKVNHKKHYPVNNSYPLSNLGYNMPNPAYSAQVIRRPDDNKYFHNYTYDYNVQVNKPVLTYSNYVTRLEEKNINNKERIYHEKLNQKYFYYNGTYELLDNKPSVLALQSNINYPISMINSNNLTPNLNNIQSYTNSSAYYGVQAKTLPGQNLIANMNAEKTKAINANINNPAYFNYGQYYY